MSIEIKRIYLENYKLFSSKTIDFENYLSVFDGPNGYGKTSIFDAIEFLITGSISRIRENQTISGTLGYSSNFLAKEQNKDVLIKGEFVNTLSSEKFVIALRIPPSLGKNSKKNNPKSIETHVETYFLPEYHTPLENWAIHKVDRDAANHQRNCYFGSQNIEFFTMLHYIRQEDRLSYFKKNEADRTEAIESLFGIETYINKSAQIEQAHKQLQQKLRALEKKVNELSSDVQNIPHTSTQSSEYYMLAEGRPKWDQQDLGFRGAKSSALFDQFKFKLEGIKYLFLHQEEFFLYRDTVDFFELPADQQSLAILAWKIQMQNQNAATELANKKSIFDFLTAQKYLLDESKFIKVNWQKLCDVLNLSSLYNEFVDLTTKIKTASANRTDLQKSLSSLKQAREQLHEGAQQLELFQQGKCPYCGQNWQDASGIDKQFSKTQQLIDAVLGREYVEYTLLVEQCKELFNKQCKQHFETIFTALESDLSLQVYSQFPNWQSFQSCANKCTSALARIGLTPEQICVAGSLPDAVRGVENIVDQIQALKNKISVDYFELNQKYNFNEIYAESFSGLNTLEHLSLAALEKKQEYITNQYYHSFDASRNQLQLLSTQKVKLEDLCEQMRAYSVAMKNAIQSYQQLVIGQIEIPFFLYSSRLLQSYQGGQGVLIKSDGKTVRFTAPGAEHDVLYTMSSGQLSAVLLAFSLALNKIYAGDAFQTILIDDPIQCMDDINMISFVELLRREFNQSQIILSTHEDTFSKYICYKFQKYGLTQQTITLKNS